MEVTHIIRDGETITDCCKKSVALLSDEDRLVDTDKPHQVNCPQYGWKNAVEEK